MNILYGVRTYLLHCTIRRLQFFNPFTFVCVPMHLQQLDGSGGDGEFDGSSDGNTVAVTVAVDRHTHFQALESSSVQVQASSGELKLTLHDMLWDGMA